MTMLHNSSRMFESEEKLPLTVAARMVFEHNGVRSPSRATLCRWIRKGKAGVKLECRRFNGNYQTSVEAILRFVNAVDEKVESRFKRDARRRRELNRVSQILDDMGI